MGLSTQRASAFLPSADQSAPPQWNYDVFLSFRGADTRNSFVSHLYHELQLRGIKTFVDDPKLERGTTISSELVKAIQESRLAIVVLSPNYASSSWCLVELTEILQCMKSKGTVLPVFYNVDPSDVRKQSGSFAGAFAEHEKRFREDIEKVKRWRAALTEVANLSGLDSKNQCERKLIENIVEWVWRKVHRTFKLLDSTELVGIKFTRQQIDWLLAPTDDVRFMGIWGMGGIGKTSIAKLVYERISNHFEVSCFLANVREVSERGNLVDLQRQLLFPILKEQITQVWDEEWGTHFIKNCLCNKKVLLILDDVDESSQLEKLVGEKDWFGKGSMIIITTRDERLLIKHDIQISYKVEGLGDDDALVLFSRNAFKKNEPEEGFWELSKCFVNYARGLPLALKVLGCSVYKRDRDEWKSELDKLNKIHESTIFHLLKISYDRLDEMNKDIFLDVAFFLKGKSKEEVIEILESCDHFGGINALVEKSLLTCDISNNIVGMHDLIQEMAFEIVRQESPIEPSGRSQLCRHDDIFHVLLNNTATNKIQGIALIMSELEKADWNSEAFSKMVNLKALEVHNAIITSSPRILPNSLRIMKWNWYSSKYLPSNFQPNKLVSLEMRDNQRVRLWDERIVPQTRNNPQMELTTKRARSPVPSAFQPKYDVFLSFRGADTCKGFTEHLYGALQQQGIKTFVDDSENQRGKAISPLLFSAIEQSKIALIVFSENYASTTWCLVELSKILECMEGGEAVLPLFYDVNPSDAGKQISRTAEALNVHEKRFEENIETVEQWRAALEKAANLRWKSSNERDEPQLIKEIVNEVLTKVRPEPQERLVGMFQRLEQLDLLLDAGSKDVHFLGIWGMAGLGKTTLAKTAFERILPKFEVGSFLDRVREASKAHGLSNLQRNLSKTVLNKNIEDWDIHEAATMRKVLREKKVLLVLDDVDQISQLETLCGNQDWFGSGSRVIITTRNEKLLITHGVERRFEVHELNDDDALQLFSWKAFKMDVPDKEYIALSKSILNYANGHPLALKVLGSLLHKRGQDAWRSVLYKLKYAFKGEIMDTLRISYDELEKQEKSIFLDIACFFKGKCKDQVVEILDNDGFCSRIAMDVLIEKSLLTISDNMVWMHDLLQEMGWEIVCQEAQEPGERSRLWLSRDIFHVLKNNLGTKAVEGIVLDLPEPKVEQCNSIAFSEMVNLRFLKIHSVLLPHGLSYLPNSLRFLEWSGYPLKALPTRFQPDKIVELSMCHSSIVQLWSGIKHLDNLTLLNLSYSQYLTRTPDFTGVRNLKRLYLEGCKSLVEIHPSIGFLKRLISLNLKGCKSLEGLPSKIEMEYLQSFILSGCSRVKKLPEFVGHMEHLREISLDGTAIENIPLSVERLTRLSSLDMRNCINLRILPSTIGSLKFLKTLDLSGCSNLAKLPESLGELKSLENIDLSRTSIEEWPSSVVLLKNLKSLVFLGPKWPSRQSWHMALPFRLMPMKSRQPMSSFLPPLSGICSLTKLNLSNCNLLEGEIPGAIGCLSSLASLNLSSNNFVSLPRSISQLSKLEYLSLSCCSNLQELPLLSSCIALQVNADGCTSMKKLQWPSNLDRLKWSCFNFINCIGLVEKEGLSMLDRYLKRIPYAGDRYEIVMPGSEIPSWFNHQKLGSSVSVQLPRNSHANKWMGYALCAGFQVFGSGWELDCLLKVNGKKQYPAPILATDVQPMSDHLWLVYISHDLSLGKEWQHRRNQLIFSFNSSGPSFVKKCGVRLVYEQDEKELNTILTPPGSKISPSEATDALHHDEKSASLQGAIVQHSLRKRPSRSSSFVEESHFKRSKAT